MRTEAASLPGQRVDTHDLGQNAVLYVLPASRFRTVHLLLAFRRVLRSETVTRGALLPRVLRRGTRRFPDLASLSGHLEDLYGASLEIASTKLGDQQVLEATFSCPSPASLAAIGGGAGASNLQTHGATLLAEIFRDPAGPGGDYPEGSPVPGLRPEYVREEKESLGRDIQSISDDRMSYAHFRCLAEMCPGEPNALHSLGRAADLGGITPANLDAFRRTTLATAPLVAYLAGPVEETTIARVAEIFREVAAGGRAIPAGNGHERRSIPPSSAHGRPEREREVFEPADVEQGRLVVGLQTGIVVGDDDAPAEALYNGLLGGFVHSRLFRRIREEAGLAYYAWSRVLPTKGIILISCGIQEKNYGQAVDLIRRELASLAAGDFTESEFAATRNSILAVAKAHLDSLSSLIYGHLERIAVGLVVDEIAPWRALARVTADDVKAFAQRPVLDTIYLLGKGKHEEARPDGLSAH